MPYLIACHDCDLLQRLPSLSMGVVAKCPRCGAILRRTQFNSLNRTIGWLIAGLILYSVAVSFPFLTMETRGLSSRTALWSGIRILHEQGMTAMALVVLLTCIILPLFAILSQLYILIPLRLKRHLPGSARLFSWLQHLGPWSMMEVYMLGILVAMVKLAKMARIVPGPGLYSFITLIFVLAASSVSLDRHLVWNSFPFPKDMDKTDPQP